MALYDQRTFKQGEAWWVAEVHSAAGAGTGPERPAMRFERVFFTNLSDPEALSRSQRIPAGSLNRLSHKAVVALLVAAQPVGGRFEMSPRNAPDADELGDLPQLVNSDGLVWVYRQKHSPEWSGDRLELRPSLEFICLDDSALRGEVSFNSSEVLDDFMSMHGTGGLRSLLPAVSNQFQDLDPEWDT